MKIKFITILSFLTLSFQLSFSQDTISAKYFPLRVGNVWVYKTTYSPFPYPPTYHRFQISRDTLIDSKKYFFYESTFSSQWIRYDSATGNLLVYSTSGGCSAYSNDKIIDSLASSPGNQIYCQYQTAYTRLCLSIGNVTLFNSYPAETKEFKHDGLIYEIYTYAKNFGIIYSCGGEPPPCSSFSNLQGCIINGVVYGDTTLTIIKQISNIVPEKISLEQNYPNPFNPKTIINYSLPNTQHTILKVYDVLGNEIATLVNQNQNSGSYSVEFDASLFGQGKNLSSGIYFYKLETANYSETRRMALVK